MAEPDVADIAQRIGQQERAMFEHLEIAAYALLRRVAQRAGDPETVQLAERILGEERAAVDKLRSLFPQALDASLRELRLPAR